MTDNEIKYDSCNTVSSHPCQSCEHAIINKHVLVNRLAAQLHKFIAGRHNK